MILINRLSSSSSEITVNVRGIRGAAVASTSRPMCFSPDRLRFLVLVSASGFKAGQPAQSPNSGHEPVFATAGHDKPRQTLQAPSDRTPRNGETLTGLHCSDDRILVGVSAKENAVIDPLGLDKLELPSKMCSDKSEDQPAIRTIVIDHTFRKQGPISGSTPDHSVNPRHSRYLCIPRVRAADVGAARSF